MKARVEKVFGNLDPKPEAVVLANAIDPHLDRSFFYLLDVPGGLFEESYAVGFPDGALHVVTGALEAQSAYAAAKGDPDVTIHEVGPGLSPADLELKSILGSARTVGLHYNELTHESYLRLGKALQGVKFQDATKGIRKARVMKDSREIERLQRAAEIGSAVALEIPSMLHAGMMERELATQMEHSMMEHGASGASFSTIVGFGANGAEPHYAPGEKRLVPGDSMVCDFGAYFRRYASDITRSFHFGPRDEEMMRVHDTVEEAQQAALAAIRPGVPARDVHLAAAQVVDESPWKGRFIHGLGHSIGLAVHDGWRMGPLSADTLEEGMAITVEPGIYLPGRGGVRIEDDIVVTKDGYKFLTTAPRGYLEVRA